MALNEGEVCAGRQSAPISELELELKHGKAGDLFKLAREMGKLAPATLSLKSKSERGYDLIEDAAAQAARTDKILLRRGVNTMDAFRTIGRSVLRHIVANEAAVKRSDSEGVHRMRIGLRRLRAAISLFSKLFDDRETERVKAELKWLANELAPARDLDVFVRNEIEPLRSASPPRGMKELAGTLRSRRDAAFGKASVAIESRRYRSLLLDTLQWLETGDWAKRARHYKHWPIELFAADILARRTRKAIKKAKRIRQLDSRQRHKLRIAVKKLRYATDFFGPVFAGRTAKKRLPDFKARLTDLQDRLGALNDIKVHQKLAPKLVAGKPSAKGRRQAFALGIVSGRERGEFDPLLSAAEKDARRFAQVRSFWI
jgi:triphosphatase